MKRNASPVSSPASRQAVFCFAAALFLSIAGWVLPDFVVLQATQWALYGLLALSLALVWGQAGIFSFGQGAFFGIGAYAYGMAAINWLPYTSETFSAVLVAALAGAVLAAALGYFMFYGKVADVYVGVITLAVTLVLFTVVSGTADPKYRVGEALLGGYNGMTGVPPLIWPDGDGGVEWSALSMFLFVVWLCAGVLAALYWMLARPFGRILTALRENEWRTQLLGFDVRLRKLLVFSLGGGIAGAAGGLYAAWGMFVSPGVFGLQLAALVVIWALVGGRSSLVGAFIGTLVVEVLTFTLGESGGNATPIVLGAVLIAVVLFLPGGLVPAGVRWMERWRARVVADASTHESVSGPNAVVSAALPPPGRTAPRDAGLALRTRNLSRHFGGVQAVQDVSIAFAARGVHCLIGPNGAGKSSFFNLLVGRFAPSRGRVLWGERDISALQPYARVRLGLGIKLQVASIFPALSVRENLWLAAYGRVRDSCVAAQTAAQWLLWSGFSEDAGLRRAADLAHGQKQWLEIAMVLAGEPAAILLDEPAAGMSSTERDHLAQLLRTVAERAAVIVVEHDMMFVQALQAPVTVLHQGNVFASGTMEDLRRDARILDIYLGRSTQGEVPHGAA